MRIFHELSAAAARRTRSSSSDSGSAANWYARHLKFHGDIRGSLSGTLATMGPGVPYAIGAKWAHPDRPAIALVGDGAMQMNGLAELITIAQYWRQWADPRLIVAVLHNNDLNQVTWEMRAMEGAPKFAESQTLPDVDYAALRPLPRAWPGVNIDDPDDARPGLGRPRWPPTGPPCSTSAATRTCRRSRRTPPSSRSRRRRRGGAARRRGRLGLRQAGHQAEGAAVPARARRTTSDMSACVAADRRDGRSPTSGPAGSNAACPR